MDFVHTAECLFLNCDNLSKLLSINVRPLCRCFGILPVHFLAEKIIIRHVIKNSLMKM